MNLVNNKTISNISYVVIPHFDFEGIENCIKQWIEVNGVDPNFLVMNQKMFNLISETRYYKNSSDSWIRRKGEVFPYNSFVTYIQKEVEIPIAISDEVNFGSVKLV